MKKRIGAVLLGVILVVVVAGLMFWSRPLVLGDPPHPAIDVIRDFDFGERDLGTTVEIAVPVWNKGRQPLLINGITTDCGCMGVFAPRENGDGEAINSLNIAPQEIAKLLVQMGVGGPPGVQERRRIVFSTNDPRNPRVEINLRVTGIARYSASPTALILGAVPVGLQVEREIQLLVADRDLPTITTVTSSNSHFRVNYRHIDFSLNPRSTTTFEPCGLLTVVFDAPTVPGDVQGAISAYCDGREQPVVLIPVSARVLPLVQLSPQELFLPRASSAGPMYTATCVCRTALMQPLKLALRDAPADITVNIKDFADDVSGKFLVIDANCLRGRVPAEGLVVHLSLAADVDGQIIPLTLKLTIQRE